MIANRELLEYATFNGNSYGTPRTMWKSWCRRGRM